MLGNVYVLIDDKGKNKGVKTFYEHKKELFKKANGKGRGVYCSVNDFEATQEEMDKIKAKTKRNIQFLKKINGVFADLDIGKSGDGQTENEKAKKKAKLFMEVMDYCMPSFTIETSNGLQPIRILKNSDISPEYQKRYVNVINGIIEWSKQHGAAGDKVKDVTRVLRIPGYYHQKEEPFMCEKHGGEGEFTLEELEEKFLKFAPKEEKLTITKKKINRGIRTTKQYDEVDALDFETVIIRAFGSIGRCAEFDKNKRLILDGRLTGTFIGKTGDRGKFLASTSHEPYEGNKITAVASIQQTSNKEAFKWILEEFNIETEDKLRKKTKKNETKKKIEESVDLNFSHITYKDKLKKAYKELKETDPDKVIKRGRKEWDNILGGIYTGKIYLIGAETGVGKTTFVNQVCDNVSKQGWKVVRYSLEDRLEDQGKEELFFEVNKLRKKNNLQGYSWTRFVNNDYNDTIFWDYVDKALEKLSKKKIVELDKKKQVNIDELVKLMEKECDNGANMFAIDHLHYFEFEGYGNNRLDLMIQNVMHRINEIARKRNVAVLLVAHYKNRKKEGFSRPDPSYFKDGAAIKQVANVIIQIEREVDDTKSTFFITKLRGPMKVAEIETDFDMETFGYTFKKTDKQKYKEKNFIS